MDAFSGVPLHIYPNKSFVVEDTTSQELGASYL